jgi:ribonucleoside-diphosphate reductase beta chain
MVMVALLILERVQFMSSFAITFAICDTGMFGPIGKAVQKIAQDELEVHAEFDKAVLREELKTERGKVAFQQCEKQITDLLDEVIDSEFEWVDFLFSEGRELVGLNAEVLKRWTLFCSKDVYQFFKIKGKHTLPKQNPLKFMENWLDISKTQPSPQEQDNAQYKVSIMRRDDADEEFDADF